MWPLWLPSHKLFNNHQELQVAADGQQVSLIGSIIKDACWLCLTNNARHVKLAELDAALKSVNLALQWQAIVLHLVTNSAFVDIWHPDREGMCEHEGSWWNASERVLGNTPGIGRRVWTDNVTLVKSSPNCTGYFRMSQRWLDIHKEGGEPVLESCVAIGSWQIESQVVEIHQQSGHTFLDLLTCWCLRKLSDQLSKPVKSIDPVPVHWKKGKLGVENNWSRLAMDIIHYNAGHFLILIDCGLSWFPMWWPLHRQNTTSVTCQLEMIFFEWGTPTEILTTLPSLAGSSKSLRAVGACIWGSGAHIHWPGRRRRSLG